MYKNLRTYARDESAYVHTPTPEVDIMRNGNKSRQLLSLARIAVLALCFTMVFAVALATAFDGTTDGIAFAAERKYKDEKNEITFGKANAISADNGYLTASDFNFLSSTTQWTSSVTSTYYNTVPYNNGDEDPSNNTEIYKKDGDTKLFLGVGDAGIWSGGVTNGYNENDLYMVLNFELGEFLNGILATGNVVIDAAITANYNKNDQVNNMYTSAVAGPAWLTGQQAYKLNNGGDSNYSYSFDSLSSNKADHTRTVTLTREKNKLSLAFGVRYPWKATSRERYMQMSNISIKFTIKPNGKNDGSAPIVASRYNGVATENVNKCEPFITNPNDASNQAKFPVYYDSIKNRLKLDSVQHGSGRLASYTNAILGNVPGLSGTGYYKFAQTEFVDTFNYTKYDSLESAAAAYGSDAPKFIGIGDKSANISSGNLTWDDMSGVDSRVSGIATVKIGNTVFTISNASDINTAKEITVTEMVGDVEQSVSVGYAIVNKTNNARVVVSVYFRTNCTLETVVTDYGNKAVTTSLTVSGIDTTAPSDSNNSGTNIFLENYVGTDGLTVSALNWFRQNAITTDANFEITEDESAAGYSPYIWFYTVDKADSISALKNKKEFATYADVKSAGILPIAAGELTSFTYDFVRGAALTVDGKTYQGNPSGMDVATGHGYYRFTFYMFDLAGNKGGEKSFFMKVDYDKPEYTLDFKYDKDGTTETIEASQNGKWATGNVTLKFTVNAGGFSGFTFIFEDSSFCDT